MIKQKDVKINIIPPKIKGLTVKRIWQYLKEDHELLSYFPDQCIENDPPREYFFTIISSVRINIFNQIMGEAEHSFWNKSQLKNETVKVSIDIAKELGTINYRQSILGRKTDKRISLQGRKHDDNQE